MAQEVQYNFSLEVSQVHRRRETGLSRRGQFMEGLECYIKEF